MKERWDTAQDPLAALRAGDPGPFEDFVTSEVAAFLAFFTRLGASRAEAEDLVQDTFLKLFRHATTYQPCGRFRGYAFRVARNAWIDRSRRRAHEPRLEGPSSSSRASGAASSAGRDADPLDRRPDPSADEPDARLTRREEGDLMRSAIARLPEGQRLVFELGVLQDLPYAQIGEALEIPVGTVKSRMFHAVRRLRELLPEELLGGTADHAAATGEGARTSTRSAGRERAHRSDEHRGHPDGTPREEPA